MAADAAELMHAGCCLSHLRFISERDNLYFLVCCQVDSGNLLPEDEYNPNCQLESKNKCLRSGDERVNDNAGLASIHTVLVREHNRLASLLETVNPHWDEETLYQEARKMVVRLVLLDLESIRSLKKASPVLAAVKGSFLKPCNHLKKYLLPSTRRRGRFSAMMKKTML